MCPKDTNPFFPHKWDTTGTGAFADGQRQSAGDRFQAFARIRHELAAQKCAQTA